MAPAISIPDIAPILTMRGGRLVELEFIFSEDVVLETIDFFDIEAAENNRNPDSEIRLYDANGLESSAGYLVRS